MARADDADEPTLVEEYAQFIDAVHRADVAALTDPDPDAGRVDAPRQDALEVAWTALHDYEPDLADGLLQAPAIHIDALLEASELLDNNGPLAPV